VRSDRSEPKIEVRSPDRRTLLTANPHPCNSEIDLHRHVSGCHSNHMVSSLASLVESGAITCKSTKTDAIDVVVLQDGTATCFDHREAVKAGGYVWNVARKEWGRCAYTPDVLLSDLLKMSILTASVQDCGALVVSNGFGNTFDARRVILQKGFRWDKASKTYRLVDATLQQRDAVHAINKEVAMRRERTSQVTRQKRLREKKKTFDETIEIIDQAIEQQELEQRDTEQEDKKKRYTERREKQREQQQRERDRMEEGLKREQRREQQQREHTEWRERLQREHEQRELERLQRQHEERRDLADKQRVWALEKEKWLQKRELEKQVSESTIMPGFTVRVSATGALEMTEAEIKQRREERMQREAAKRKTPAPRHPSKKVRASSLTLKRPRYSAPHASHTASPGRQEAI